EERADRVAAHPVVREQSRHGRGLWCERLDPDPGRIVLGESLAVRVTHGDDLLDALIRQQFLDRVRAQVELLRERVRLTALRAGRAVRSERDEALHRAGLEERADRRRLDVDLLGVEPGTAASLDLAELARDRVLQRDDRVT